MHCFYFLINLFLFSLTFALAFFRINEMGGFANPRLEMGDYGGAANGSSHTEDEYVMPSTSKHVNGNK